MSLGGQLGQRRDVVTDFVEPEATIHDVLEGLPPLRGPPAIDHVGDEAQLRDGLRQHRGRGRERPRCPNDPGTTEPPFTKLPMERNRQNSESRTAEGD